MSMDSHATGSPLEDTAARALHPPVEPPRPQPGRLVRSVHLGGHHPVHDVDVEFTPFTVIIGRNDTGKSTILDCIEAVLSERVPDGDRPGWWAPTEQAEAFIRSRVELPTGRLVVKGPEHGHACTLQVGETTVECPASLAPDLIRPAGEVVRLDPSRSVHDTSDATMDFLAAIVEDSLVHGWGSLGDPGDPTDVRHLFDDGHELAGWVRPALDLLARRAFDLMPEILAGEYRRLRLDLVVERSATVVPEMTLVGDRGDCAFQDLASGMQSWVHLAVREAGRRLRRASTIIDGDHVEVTASPPQATLFLIDEPERHLHPAAASAIAHWLHSLTTREAQNVSVVVATHSPAFLELHRLNDVTVLQCLRRDIADDNLDHSVTVVRQWAPPQVRAVAEQADEIGMTLPDVFFTGSLPVVVEGRYDLEYFRRIWPMVCGVEADALGIRFFNAGGVPAVGDLISELVIAIYPPATPVVVITDNPGLDRPTTGNQLDAVVERFPQVQVLSHKGFDIWSMIPEDVLDRFKLRLNRTRTWQSLEDRRRVLAKRRSRSHPPQALPGKSWLLKPTATRAWPQVLASLTADDVPKRASTIVNKVNTFLRSSGT